MAFDVIAEYDLLTECGQKMAALMHIKPTKEFTTLKHVRIGRGVVILLEGPKRTALVALPELEPNAVVESIPVWRCH